MATFRTNTPYSEISKADSDNGEQSERKNGNTGLPFGLCKKYGISLPENATPREAWDALKRKTGMTPEQFYADLKDKGEVQWTQEEKLKTNEFQKRLISYVMTFSDEEIKKSSGWLLGVGSEDHILKRIIEMAGYNGKPKTIPQKEIDNLVRQGHIGIMRGMKVDFGAKQYIQGEMYIGRGAHGSGVYVSAYQFDKDTVYGSKEFAQKTADKYAYNPKTGLTGSIFCGILEKNSKIIKESELKKIKEEIVSKMPEKAQRIFSNNGRLAVFLGYDAIDCENAYMVILNRTKTVIGV